MHTRSDSYRDHNDVRIHSIQDIISRDVKVNWSIPELSDVAGISSRHLARRFRMATGISVRQYSQHLRIALARILIERTAISVEEVATEVGFASAQHLRRIWRRYQAVSPRLHRKLAATHRRLPIKAFPKPPAKLHRVPGNAVHHHKAEQVSSCS